MMRLIIAFFLGGFVAVGVVVARITMLDLDVAVIHVGGKCVAISQHPGGGQYEFGAPDASGKCYLGWRLFR